MMNLLFPKDLKKIQLKVASSQGKCKYHPRVGKTVSLFNSFPKGICPYLYISAYPYALSLLYDAQFSWRKKIDKDSVIGQCCRPIDQMAFKVKRVKNPKINKRLLKKYQEERYRINIHLIEKRGMLNNCSDCLGYKQMVVGKVFEFNRGELAEICPAAFSNAFPLLVELSANRKKSKGFRFACPDPKTNVIFEVNRK